MTTKASVEVLCRYLDGELPADEHIRIEAILAEDDEARALLEDLKFGNALAGQSYSGFDANPPADVESAIKTFGEKTRLGSRVGSRWAPFAMAASLLLAILGGPMGYWLGQREGEMRVVELKASQAEARQEMERAIDRALETLVSGQSLPWQVEHGAGEGTVTPVRTFQNHDGRWCREFSLSGKAVGEDIKRQAIACRKSEGDWQVLLEMFEEQQAPSL